MAISPLPEVPNLENLRKRAKSLLRSAKSGNPDALALIGPYFGDPRTIGLQQAQLVLAREYGFPSWTTLTAFAANPGDAERESAITRFLDLVTVVYGDMPDAGPKRFEQAADVLAANPDMTEHSLHAAAAAGDTVALRRHLDRDPAGLDAKTGPFNWTPLMHAAYARLPGRSSWPAARMLLDAGADPNSFYMWGGQYRFTALTGVFGEGEGGPQRQPAHPDANAFARAMLEAGANPNDSQAAYNRCFRPDNAWLALLIEFGLKPDARNNWLVGPPDKLQPSPVETLHFQLIMAIKSGYAERVAMLIKAGMDVNKPDNTYEGRTFGRTPYEVALICGHTEIAERLVKAGAVATDLSPVDQFAVACATAEEAAARSILAAEPRVLDLVDQRDLLCMAVDTHNTPALALMIALGFDVDAGRDRTALHQAAFHGRMEMIDMLLDAGADPTIKDKLYGAMPWGFAKHAGQDAAVARLERAMQEL